MRQAVLLESVVPGQCAIRASALLAAVLLATPVWAGAEGVQATGAPDVVSAVWTPQQLQFKVTSDKYMCKVFQKRVTALLIALGARQDLQVDTKPCMDSALPVTFNGVMGGTHYLPGPSIAPHVAIRMQVLRVSAETRAGSDAVPAHWKSIDLMGTDGPLSAEECALAERTAELLLPLFSTRNVEFSPTHCRDAQPKAKFLLEVLVADQK